jgi:hypothetical protein
VKNRHLKKILSTAFVIITFLIIVIGYSTNKYLNTPTSFTNKQRFLPTDTTEVILLGTLHRNSKNVAFDSLYNILERIKPNIVLFEMDSTGFNNKMKLKNTISSIILPNFLSRYQPANLEEIAVKKYQHFNPTSIIRPYEWSYRNKFHKRVEYNSIEIKCFPEISSLYNLKKLNGKHDSIYKNFLSLTKQLNKYAESTLMQINTSTVDILAKQRQFIHYIEIKKIVDENERLSGYREYFQVYSSYWETRNTEMAKNICHYIKLYPHSKIVVLNGYFHRYFLLEELRKKQVDLNFKIVEINDIN